MASYGCSTIAELLGKYIFRAFLLGLLLTALVGCAGHGKRTARFSHPRGLEITSREEILLGEKVFFKSNILKEMRSYWVHLPKSYHDAV